MKDYLAQDKTFDKWSVFYGMILLCSLVYNSIYTFQFYDFSDFFINYQGGFVRRGLLGELLYCGYRHGVNPIYAAYSLSLLAYMVLLVYMIRHFRRHGFRVGLLLVSFLLGGVGVFGLAFFRRDFIILCLFLLTVRLWRKMPFRRWIVCGNVITMVVLLCHEPYMFWAFPLLCLLTHRRTRNWWSSLLCWIPSILVFLLCLHFSGSEEVYAAIRRSTEPFLEYPNVIDFLSFDRNEVIQLHLHYNFTAIQHHVPNVIGSVVSIFVGIYYCVIGVPFGKTSGMNGQVGMVCHAMFLCVMFCLVPMFTILSTDYTRTLMYASLSSYIVFFEVPESELLSLFPSWAMRCVDKVVCWLARLLPPSRVKMMFIILFLSAVEWTGQGTFGLLRNSELGNTLMVIYKVMMKAIECLG